MVDKSNAYDLVITDLKRQRAEIDSMIGKLEAMAGGQVLPPAGTPDAPMSEGDSHAAPDAENNPYLGMSVADATVALLKKTRRAMSAVEIVQHLEAGGLLLSGSNKSGTVATLLTRRQKRIGDLVRPKRGLWGLKEWYRGRNFGKSEGSNSKEESAASDATSPNELPQDDREDPEDLL